MQLSSTLSIIPVGASLLLNIHYDRTSNYSLANLKVETPLLVVNHRVIAKASKSCSAFQLDDSEASNGPTMAFQIAGCIRSIVNRDYPPLSSPALDSPNFTQVLRNLANFLVHSGHGDDATEQI